MAGVVADDRCPRCGGPLTTYRDGARRCKPCRSAERSAQMRRQKARTGRARDLIAPEVARITPTSAEVAAAQSAWASGRAGETLTSLGVTTPQAAALIGATRRATHNWYQGLRVPSDRYAERAAALLLAADVIARDTGAAATDGAIGYDDLGDDAKRAWGNFEYFRRHYLGSVSTPWQINAAERLVELLERPQKTFVVVSCPQGSGKTRTFPHDFAAYLTVRDRSMRGLIGSLGRALSESLVGNLRDTLARDVPVIARDIDKARGLALDAHATLSGDYGPFQGGQLWRRDRFFVAQHGGQPAMHKDPTWAAFSREAAFLGWRVDVAIWDDLMNTELLRNPDRVDDLEQWFKIEAESRVDDGGLCMVVGQRLGANDIYRRLLDRIVEVEEIDDTEPTQRQYVHFKYQAHNAARCTGDHGRDAPPTTFAADGTPSSGGCQVDPLRVPWRDQLEKRAAGIWEIVHQQEDVDPASVLVQRDWVEGCWDDDRTIGTTPANLPPATRIVRVISCDPSPTKWWGIIDFLYLLPADDGIGPTDGYRYVIDVARRKMGADQFLDRDAAGTYIGLAETWVQRAKAQGFPVEYVVMEANGAQRWLNRFEFARNWAATRSLTVLEHQTTANKADPELGVWTAIPAQWRYARVRLPGGDRDSRLAVNPLVEEVCTYPGAATDDLLMSMWFFEYNLDSLVGSLGTNQRRFYDDEPSSFTGANRISFAAQRVAQMVIEQTGQRGAA